MLSFVIVDSYFTSLYLCQVRSFLKHSVWKAKVKSFNILMFETLKFQRNFNSCQFQNKE